MTILVIGGGGREHALVWKLAQSPKVRKIFVCPGNPGMAAAAECVDVAVDRVRDIVAFAAGRHIDFTVVGPEAPLAAGLVDAFHRADLPIFGPEKQGARLEASKVFCKQLLFKHDIPTAAFQEFHHMDQAIHYLHGRDFPLVVKADGLAAGKGVMICRTYEEAERAIRDCMEKRMFGDAGGTVLIEDFLEGEEASILAITDGHTVLPLIPSQDHKPVHDGDHGPNTGGMGAYCPAPVIHESMARQIEADILVPTLHALRTHGIRYRGVLYAGLMITRRGPYVLEYNVRFGDPETQPLMACMESDLLPILEAAANGTLDQAQLTWKRKSAVCVVMTSAGYPGAYAKGKPITGLDRIPGEVVVFHAGTKRDHERLVTDGGRVLGVTALGADLAKAKALAYKAIEGIHFDGAHYRTDIADKALAPA